MNQKSPIKSGIKTLLLDRLRSYSKNQKSPIKSGIKTFILARVYTHCGIKKAPSNRGLRPATFVAVISLNESKKPHQIGD